MQTPEQIKNWKVVASVATVAALGVSGLAIASPGDSVEIPPPIEIQDTRDRGVFTATTSPGFEIVPAPSFTMDDSFDSFDSPLASFDTNDSPDSSPDLQDSPDDSPVTTSAQDSPDDSPVARSVNDSPDDSLDSPDDSPDHSLDSLDT